MRFLRHLLATFVLALLLPFGAHAATLVQVQAGTTTGTPVTLTPATTITTGNDVIIGVQYGNGSALTVTSVKNQAAVSLTFSELATAQFDAGNGAGAHLLLIQNIPAGVTAITITMSSSGWDLSAALAEFSGLKTTGAADPTGNAAQLQTGVATTTDAVTSGLLTPTSTPGILIAIGTNCSNGTQPTAGTGFTSLATIGGANGQGSRFEYRTNSGTSATSATFTNASGGGQTFVTLASVVLDAGGGGGTFVNPISGRGGAAAQPIVH